MHWIARAKTAVQFQAAVTNAGLARQDSRQAFDALLPALPTTIRRFTRRAPGQWRRQATGVPVVFIANNAVHEYISRETCMRQLTPRWWQIFARRPRQRRLPSGRRRLLRAGCGDGDARILRGGPAAQQKVETAKRNAYEGDRFFKITQDREQGGEVAHADVIKAELQTRERQRALQEAQLAFLNARLDLAVLIFPNFEENFEVADDLHAPVALPMLAEVQERAARDNPDLRAALALVAESNHGGVWSARRIPAFAPDAGLFYGDAATFATHTF